MQINKGNIKVLGPELSFNLFRERENRYMNGSIDMLPCCMLDGNPDVSNTEHTVSPGSSDPFYILTSYIKWVTTSWTYCICTGAALTFVACFMV